MATEIDPELIARINYEFETFGHMLPETLEKYKAAAAGVREFEMKMNLATKATGALYQTFTTYNRAVYDGIKGYKDLASTTDALATSVEAVTAALAFILPIGRAAKIATAALGLLGGEALRFSKVIGEQADNVRKGFDGLAEIGATAGDGMQGVFEGMQRLGLGVQEADHMIRLLGDNAEIVSLFGGTMKQGSRVFEDTVDSMKPMSRDFLSLGIQFKDFSTVGMNYLRVQKQMTMGTREQMDTSGAAVKRYVEEMDEMTRLTGLSRKKQEQILEDAYREEAFAAKMDDLRARAAEAKASGNKAEETRLNNAVDMYEKGLRHAAATSTEMAEAYMTGVSGFVGNSEKSIALFQASNGKIQELNNNIEQGAIKTDADLARSFRGVNQSVGEFGKTFRQNYMAKAMGGFGVSYETTRKAAERANMSLEDYNKTLNTAKKEQAEQTGKEGKQDEILALSNNMLTKSQQKMLESQRAVQGMLPGYMKTTEGVTDSLGYLTSAAIAAAEALGLIAGPKKPPPTEKEINQGLALPGSTAAAENKAVTAREERADVAKQLDEAKKSGDKERVAVLEKQLTEANSKVNASDLGVNAATNREGLAAAHEKAMSLKKVADAEKVLEAKKKEKQDKIDKADKVLADLKQKEAALKGKSTVMLTRQLKEAEEELARAKANAALEAEIMEADKKLKEATEAEAQVREKYNPQGTAPTKSTIQKLIGAESGGRTDVKNPNSSAFGLGQFTKGTFEDLAKRKDAPAAIAGKTWDEYKKDPAIQRAALEDLTKRNQSVLAKEGIPTSDTATYLAHFLGSEGVKKLYAAGDNAAIESAVSKEAIASNKEVFGKLKTVRDLKLWAGKKMGEPNAVALEPQRKPTAVAEAKPDEKDKPRLADGGIVKANPGGTEVIVGEAGQAEAVIPLKGGAVPVHLNSTPTFAGMNEYKGYNAGPMSTDLAMLQQIAGKLGAYDKSTQMITDPKLWKEILQSGMMTNYDFGETAVGTKDLSSRVGSETVADAIAGRIKELIDSKKDSGAAVSQTTTEVANMMKTFYEDFFAKMNSQQQQENPVQIEMLATLKEISKSGAAAAGSSEQMLRYTQN